MPENSLRRDPIHVTVTRRRTGGLRREAGCLVSFRDAADVQRQTRFDNVERPIRVSRALPGGGGRGPWHASPADFE
jgi:hypothetical protein